MHFVNVLILCVSLLLCGVSSSLVNSFFTEESLSRGVTVAQCGVIIGIKFFANVLSSFMVGNFMGVVISARNVLICGLLIVSVCNSLFSLLFFIVEPVSYIVISISLRIFLALGETSIIISGYSQVGAHGGENHQGNVEYEEDIINIFNFRISNSLGRYKLWNRSYGGASSWWGVTPGGRISSSLPGGGRS